MRCAPTAGSDAAPRVITSHRAALNSAPTARTAPPHPPRRTAPRHTHRINNGCTGNRATSPAIHTGDAPAAIASSSICTFAGKTATSSAISPTPAARRVARGTSPIAPATSATPLASVAARGDIGTHRGTIASKNAGATK